MTTSGHKLVPITDEWINVPRYTKLAEALEHQFQQADSDLCSKDNGEDRYQAAAGRPKMQNPLGAT